MNAYDVPFFDGHIPLKKGGRARIRLSPLSMSYLMAYVFPLAHGTDPWVIFERNSTHNYQIIQKLDVMARTANAGDLSFNLPDNWGEGGETTPTPTPPPIEEEPPTVSEPPPIVTDRGSSSWEDEIQKQLSAREAELKRLTGIMSRRRTRPENVLLKAIGVDKASAQNLLDLEKLKTLEAQVEELRRKLSEVQDTTETIEKQTR